MNFRWPSAYGIRLFGESPTSHIGIRRTLGFEGLDAGRDGLCPSLMQFRTFSPKKSHAISVCERWSQNPIFKRIFSELASSGLKVRNCSAEGEAFRSAWVLRPFSRKFGESPPSSVDSPNITRQHQHCSE